MDATYIFLVIGSISVDTGPPLLLAENKLFVFSQVVGDLSDGFDVKFITVRHLEIIGYLSLL